MTDHKFEPFEKVAERGKHSITITPAERMEKALARAQAFVKLHGHDNTACITSGELFLFRDALKCAQTEIEHWGKLYLIMTKDEQRLTKMVDWLAKALVERGHFIGDISSSSIAANWKEAARRAVADESGVNNDRN